MPGVFHVLFIFLAYLAGLSDADSIILRPISGRNESAASVGLIILQGAQVHNSAYLPLAKTLQMYSQDLWITIPSFPADIPILNLQFTLSAARRALVQAGFPEDAPLFIAGHSLGGIQAQKYVEKFPRDIRGLILLGANLERKYFEHNTISFPVPTLTIGGEIDGLLQVIRIAECSKQQESDPAHFPIVIVDGMTHMQFASGKPPALVKKQDLKPEISNSEAHKKISSMISEFIHGICTNRTSEVLTQEHERSRIFLHPLVESLNIEGFVHFGNRKSFVVPWVSAAYYEILSEIPDIKLEIRDLSSSDFSGFAKFSSQKLNQNLVGVNVTILSSLKYATLDGLDTPFTYTSAEEIASKMVSPSWILNNINRTEMIRDSWSKDLCMRINQKAMKWALDSTPERTRARYLNLGVQMEFESDFLPSIELRSIWKRTNLQFNQVTDERGRVIVRVRSPYIEIPDSGNLWCKLISPARIMEWIYTNSLHEYDGQLQEISLIK